MDEAIAVKFESQDNDIKENKAEIRELNSNMNKLTLTVNDLAGTVKNVLEGVKNVSDRVTKIEVRPLVLWEKVKIALISCIVTGTIGSGIVYLIISTIRNMK